MTDREKIVADLIKNAEIKRQELINDLPEWYQPSYNGAGSCPWCENFQHEGHAFWCNRNLVKDILKAALG